MVKGYTARAGQKRVMAKAVLVFVIMVAVLAWPLGTAQGAIIKYGYYSTPASNIYPSVPANYLLGFAINVPIDMVLTHVGIIDKPNNNVYVKVGVYADSGGTPGALVAQSSPFHMQGFGDTLIPMDAATLLTPGNYWIMPNYDSPGAILTSPGDFNVPTKYLTFTYGTPLPTTFPAHSTYSGIPTSYYLASDIPEPATMSLLAIGGLTLLLRKRKA